MSSLNPWTNLTEVPEAYSDAQSTTSYSKRWDPNESEESDETIYRVAVVRIGEGVQIGEFFTANEESETRFDEFNWAMLVVGDTTSGVVTQYAYHHGKLHIGSRFDVVGWGQSIESECPWIQNFDRKFGLKSSVKNLKRMFLEVASLVDGGNYEQLDRILRVADPQDYNLDFATGYLRATFMYRDRLPSWRGWLRKTEDYLFREGEDTDAELAGLK